MGSIICDIVKRMMFLQMCDSNVKSCGQCGHLPFLVLKILLINDLKSVHMVSTWCPHVSTWLKIRTIFCEIAKHLYKKCPHVDSMWTHVDT